MAYYYYAETNLVYLFNRWRRRVYRKHPERLADLEEAGMHFGDDNGEKVVVWMLRIGTAIAVFCGSLVGSGIVWTLGDIGVGAMAWINIVAILLLSPQALRSLKDYERQKKNRASNPSSTPLRWESTTPNTGNRSANKGDGACAAVSPARSRPYVIPVHVCPLWLVAAIPPRVDILCFPYHQSLTVEYRQLEQLHLQ